MSRRKLAETCNRTRALNSVVCIPVVSWQPRTSLLASSVTIIVICAAQMSACGVNVQRATVGYYFSRPILNSSWTEAYYPVSTKIQRQRLSRKRRKRARPKAYNRRRRRTDKRNSIAKSGSSSVKRLSRSRADYPREIARRGGIDLIRAEVVASARRILGIRNSFTQDSFLRHILIVNNLCSRRIPQNNLIEWVYRKFAVRFSAGSKNIQFTPGDLIFFGKPKPYAAAIVEHVSHSGAVTFIGLIGGEVKRGTLSILRPATRRDEKTGTILNSFLAPGKLAGTDVSGAVILGKSRISSK